MVVRLIACFDGTWDRPDANPNATLRVESNVCWFQESIVKGTLPDGSEQRTFYDTGVGTNWWDQIAGGAFGLGLDQKIQDGYTWLSNNYPDPDPGNIEVFVVGFSRGAYTARSLVGMIRNVGLLKPQNDHRVADAYALYRNRDDSADTPQAVAFRQRYSREIKIKFLGVWDTVGALGIPLPALQWLNAKEYAFHDTELSGIVANAAHAVAIDEHRVDYNVTLWDPIKKPGQTVEQRWCLGAHTDVGGGNQSRHLSDITLAWMQGKAAAAGLAITRSDVPAIGTANWMETITDSYGEFLGGLYAKMHDPFYRPMALAGSNEVLDETAIERRDIDAAYRPKNPGFPEPGAGPGAGGSGGAAD
jgi:uncharacterized protein (DUF2235 family)